ncbi:hypothetical protein [Holzapfeliella floricola]|uniref:hypothetical protein n=1 Tax=Holzapfeliella floricola TaxID=679249 RepID=UPI000A5DA6D3|nr:hypothetical protein [Holzapfeliella floricola]
MSNFSRTRERNEKCLCDESITKFKKTIATIFENELTKINKIPDKAKRNQEKKEITFRKTRNIN